MDVRTDTSQNWFLETRIAWIADTLRIFGSINRIHLERKFNISNASAALSILEFNKRYPQAMTYDAKERKYVFNGSKDSGFVTSIAPMWFGIDHAKVTE